MPHFVRAAAASVIFALVGALAAPVAAQDASDEEVLTRQRSLATAYRLGGSVGLSFTFRSIFSAIVNPRLDDLR